MVLTLIVLNRLSCAVASWALRNVTWSDNTDVISGERE
jgi:hypothetical protein